MTSSSILTPLKDLKVAKHQIPAYGLTPNTSIQNKPLLVYKEAFKQGTSAAQIEEHLRGIGEVEPAWRYTVMGDAGLCLRMVFANEDWKLQMYSTSHFHSTSHELLCISTGSARLCFGHEDNPSNITPTVSAGDVIVVPAGVAHRLLEDIEGGFCLSLLSSPPL
ncbi:hypothetical protein D6C99_10659 [Aureobasidium pullulans]|nr:hypothetical protein D6C99_10659 [Aureobasidium pullulans]